MKQLLLLFALFCLVQVQAQVAPQGKTKAFSALNKWTISATAGTSSFSMEELKTLNLRQIRQISLGELSIAYKMTERLSFGLGTMGSLNNGSNGYYNAENQFISLCDDDDDHDEPHDDDDHDMDDHDDMHDDDDDDDDDCDEDDIGQNLMGSVTFVLSDKFPLFVQAAAGYSFADRAPAYTTMIGYHQKLFAGFGIRAGIRMSDVLHQKPIDAVKLASPMGIKAELGMSWNF